MKKFTVLLAISLIAIASLSACGKPTDTLELASSEEVSLVEAASSSEPPAEESTEAPAPSEAPASSKAAAASKAVASASKAEVPAPAASQTITLAVNLNAFALEFGRLVNVERAKAGLNALSINQDLKLVECAKIRAEEISRTFSHTRPDGSGVWDLVDQKASLENLTVGENLTGCGAGAKDYASTPEMAMKSLMMSEGHKSNLLNPKWEQGAYAVFQEANGKLWWVQLFVIN